MTFFRVYVFVLSDDGISIEELTVRMERRNNQAPGNFDSSADTGKMITRIQDHVQFTITFRII